MWGTFLPTISVGGSRAGGGRGRSHIHSRRWDPSLGPSLCSPGVQVAGLPGTRGVWRWGCTPARRGGRIKWPSEGKGHVSWRKLLLAPTPGLLAGGKHFSYYERVVQASKRLADAVFLSDMCWSQNNSPSYRNTRSTASASSLPPSREPRDPGGAHVPTKQTGRVPDRPASACGPVGSKSPRDQRPQVIPKELPVRERNQRKGGPSNSVFPGHSHAHAMCCLQQFPHQGVDGGAARQTSFSARKTLNSRSPAPTPPALGPALGRRASAVPPGPPGPPGSPLTPGQALLPRAGPGVEGSREVAGTTTRETRLLIPKTGFNFSPNSSWPNGWGQFAADTVPWLG